MSPRDMPLAAAALRMSAGILVWALHFAVIYGYTGLACARRFHASGEAWVAAIPWVIGVSTVMAVAALVAFIAPLPRASEGFIAWTGSALAGLALVAVVLEGITFLWVPVCS